MPKLAPSLPKRELNVWQILNVDGNTAETIRLVNCGGGFESRFKDAGDLCMAVLWGS